MTKNEQTKIRRELEIVLSISRENIENNFDFVTYQFLGKQNSKKTPTVHFVSKNKPVIRCHECIFYRVFNSTYLVTVGDLYQKMSQ